MRYHICHNKFIGALGGEGQAAHRALLRHPNGPPRPFTLGSSASCPTCTLSMKMEPVIEQRSASLFLIAGAERPLVPYTRR